MRWTIEEKQAGYRKALPVRLFIPFVLVANYLAFYQVFLEAILHDSVDVLH